MSDDAVVREEVRSAVEARRELGEDMEPALVDAFVARIEQRLADRSIANEWALERKRKHQREMVLGAMGISVPLLLFAGIFTGLAGVITVCIAVTVIAIATSRT